jgi:hypothetical protein
MTTRYEVRILSSQGVLLKILDRFTSLQITHGLNAIGTLALTLPTGIIESYFVEPDTRIEVWRSVTNGPLKPVLNQTWFCRKPVISYGSGSYTTTINAQSALSLLDTRIINTYEGTAQADKTGPADNIIKAYCREALGGLASSDRSLSAWLDIETNTSQAPSVSAAASRKPLLQVCKEIAQDSASSGTRLYFDIIGAGGTKFGFCTWTNIAGIDRRSQLTLSPEFGNLDNVTWTRDFESERTVVIAGGAGQGANRIIQTAANTAALQVSPFARRELFVNASQAETNDAVLGYARSQMRANRARQTLTGTIIQNASTIFGIHWGLGDLVRGQILDTVLDCMIEAVSIRVQDGLETITGQLRSI